jgi:hypothetical protein
LGAGIFASVRVNEKDVIQWGIVVLRHENGSLDVLFIEDDQMFKLPEEPLSTEAPIEREHPKILQLSI